VIDQLQNRRLMRSTHAGARGDSSTRSGSSSGRSK